MTSIRWLHLTDFHQGMNSHEWLWPTMRERLFEDLDKLHAKMDGPLDLVLFTGDLTQKGSPEEFKVLEETLALLWERFRILGSKPLLLAVPGNHDLVRPPPKKGTVKGLEGWVNDKDIQDDVWSREPNEYNSQIKEVFSPYVSWQGRSEFHAKNIQTGLLPGDFAFTFEKDGSKLGVIGLNSAFLQLTGNDYKGRLELDPRQLQAVCDGDAPTWLARHDATVLLTHHPQDWLHGKAKTGFNSEILARDNFTFHLFGHMHAGASERIKRGGGPGRLFIQGPSLFGLEHSGEHNQEDRIHGYGAGKLEFKETEIGLTFWPRLASIKADGYRMLGADASVELDENESWSETWPRKRARQHRPSEPTQPSAQAAPPPVIEDKEVRPRMGRPAVSASDYLRLNERALKAVTRMSAIGKQLRWGSFAKQGEELMETLQQEPYRVVITGKSRAGKSTLLNAMIGRDLCPSQWTLTTAVPITISPSDKESITIKFEKERPKEFDGPVSKDMLAPYADQQHNPDNEKGVSEIKVALANEVLNLGVMYVDIPGFDDPSHKIWSATDDTIQRAHALVLVVDASTFATGGFALDKKTIELLLKAKARNCPVFVICNKAERLSPEERQGVAKVVRSSLERHDVWKMLRHPPFLLSATAASISRAKKEPAPPEYEAFHDALWTSLWNTETIGLRRLFNVFEQLQNSRQKLAVLIAARQAQEPDRVRLQTALNRCIGNWNKVHDGCKEAVSQARQRVHALCNVSAAEFRLELKDWVAALPTNQEMPKPSDAVDSLTKRILPRWQKIVDQVWAELERELMPLEKYMRRGLAELAAEIGSSPQDKQASQLLEALSVWKDGVEMPTPDHAGRYAGKVAGWLTFGLAAFLFPAGAMVGAVAGAVISTVFDWFSNHVETRAELESELAKVFKKHWSNFEAHLKGKISDLGQSLSYRIRSRMNPFVEDMRAQINDIRDVSEQELELFDEMTLEIKGAMDFIHKILQDSDTAASSS